MTGANDDLGVTGFRGSEQISRLYEFQIDLSVQSGALDLGRYIEQPCELRISGPSVVRHVHGIIRGIERTGAGRDTTYYRAELVPVHWLLTQRAQSRIFQAHNCPDMTVPGIIRKVFETAGIPDNRYRFATRDTYDPRKYVVQYRETDANFIFRLMEDEGMFYFFEHDADGYRMVLGDAPVAHKPAPAAAEVPFRESRGLLADQEQPFVYAVRDRHDIRSGRVSLDDFDFKQPDKDLLTSVSVEDSDLEQSDYPGKFDQTPAGERYARIRLEAHQCRRRTVRLTANVRTFQAGTTFALIQHPQADLNENYLVTAARHEAQQSQAAEQEAAAGSTIGYTVELEAIPASVPFRPQRDTRRPTVQGSQTAIVVGPKQEEIYCDEYGRVRVQFHWDREGRYNEFSSCWIRVSHGLAGGRYGMQFLPRVGQEVIVDFLEGDPDQPIINGRVYNKDHMPPYPLPDDKTRSGIKTHTSPGGGGCNEIRFEDRKGSEQLFLHAQRQMDTRVRASHLHTVGADYHLLIGGENKGRLSGEYREKVFKAKHTHVKGERRTWIEEDESLVVGGEAAAEFQASRSIAVKGPVLDTFDEDHKHEVTQTYHCEANAIKLVANQVIELTCGPSRIVLSPSGIHLEGPQIHLAGAPGPVAPFVNLVVTGPAPAEDPGAADRTKPGQDTRYDKDPDDPDKPDKPDPVDPVDPDKPTKTTWVEIELVDQEGAPVPRERYEVVDSADRLFRGRLDKQGFAHIDGVAPGMCMVTFPRLDMSIWRRAGAPK